MFLSLDAFQPLHLLIIVAAIQEALPLVLFVPICLAVTNPFLNGLLMVKLKLMTAILAVTFLLEEVLVNNQHHNKPYHLFNIFV